MEQVATVPLATRTFPMINLVPGVAHSEQKDHPEDQGLRSFSDSHHHLEAF